FIAAYAQSTGLDGQKATQFPVWINLEYLSAEPYVERAHGLPSPVMSGPAKGWTKHFYYPGFSAQTGGLLREPDLLQRQQAFAQEGQRAAWLARNGVAWEGEQLVSLFCYEPPALRALLEQLDAQATPTRLLVTPGRAQQAVQAACAGLQRLRIAYLPHLTQRDFDHLLWACDLNCVRGEDSVVRGLWAGKPLVWHIYPQQDAAHHAKLDAFLDMLDADATLRAFHYAWNGVTGPSGSASLPLIHLNTWSKTMQATRQRLLQMDDLGTQLIAFVLKKR
ncbi:MAG: elongation factor P maturation arginine rhamnosyltransferase EarP, partial [Rhodoferax sp.]